MLLQRLLLVIGLTSLGATAGGLGLGYLSAMTLFRPRPGEDPSLAWGSAIGVLICLALGAVVGGLAGFIVAMGRRGPGDSHGWTLPTWLGIAFGLTAGLWIGLVMPEHRLGLIGEIVETWPGCLVFMTACGTLGGITGHQVPWRPTSRRTNVRRPRSS